MLKAVENVNDEIADALVGFDALDQRDIDQVLLELDGTDEQGHARRQRHPRRLPGRRPAAADELAVPLYRYLGGVNAHVLPVPMMNILNGGEHADNNVDVQEFMIMPVGAATFAEALRWGAEIFHALKKVLHDKGLSHRRRRRGRLRPEPGLQRGGRCSCSSPAIEKAGYKPGEDIAIALDAASTEFYKDGNYVLAGEGRTLSRRRDGRLLRRRSASKYPIVSIEDGMAEDDWDGWKAAHRHRSATKVQLVGDDLFVTNVERLARGIDAGVGQLDPHQGQPDRHAHRDPRGRRAWPTAHGYTAVISHRSGETEDTTIADLAVATNCGQIKTGAPARSDRVAKYNQLLRIEEELGESAAYWGSAALKQVNRQA